MKFFVTLSALSAITSTWAYALIPRQTFPPCSQSCLTSADFGSCNPTDDTCLCKSPAFISSTASCIASSCTGNDLTEANQAAQQLCLAVGVTLTDSSITITPSSTAGGSSTSGGSSASVTSPASGSSSASGTSSAAAATSSSPSNGALSNSGANTLASLAVFGLVAAVAL
ncbi:hypothetical protein GYMLUDRAFT_35824 [Collybiopsis luxurians FD-317 M1]|nr:hypothetical protein GYMLUDRAFT_35824 [Collybiopsis luxurians FD-317 M1]